MKNVNKYLIVIAGPTAIGKTSLAIKIAQHFNTEILSADSRQFYKELNIGVARPSEEELAVVPHHFIGHISINDTYTAASFEKDALNKLDQLFKKNNTVVMAGGSGLFINAVLKGLDNLPKDTLIRNELNSRLEKEGLQPLSEQLKQLDSESYKNIDINNPHRVIRTLEICLASGSKASLLKTKNTITRSFTAINIALNTDRTILYNRINSRVVQMLKYGLVEEAKQLQSYKELNALKTVGYKELFDCFDNETSLERAVELIQQHTRNYAKRQLTWFRREENYTWFEPNEAQKAIDHIENLIK